MPEKLLTSVYCPFNLLRSSKDGVHQSKTDFILRPGIRMHAFSYNRSAAHGAQWQELELILRRLLQHGNMSERRKGVAHASLRPAETFMRACRRPTEAAHFRVQKGANNRQLIVAGVQRFL